MPAKKQKKSTAASIPKDSLRRKIQGSSFGVSRKKSFGASGQKINKQVHHTENHLQSCSTKLGYGRFNDGILSSGGNSKELPEDQEDDVFKEDFEPPLLVRSTSDECVQKRKIDGDVAEVESPVRLSEEEECLSDIQDSNESAQHIRITEEFPYLRIDEMADENVPHGLLQLFDAGVFCTDTGEILCNFKTGKWYKILGLKGVPRVGHG